VSQQIRLRMWAEKAEEGDAQERRRYIPGQNTQLSLGNWAFGPRPVRVDPAKDILAVDITNGETIQRREEWFEGFLRGARR